MGNSHTVSVSVLNISGSDLFLIFAKALAPLKAQLPCNRLRKRENAGRARLVFRPAPNSWAIGIGAVVFICLLGHWAIRSRIRPCVDGLIQSPLHSSIDSPATRRWLVEVSLPVYSLTHWPIRRTILRMRCWLIRCLIHWWARWLIRGVVHLR